MTRGAIYMLLISVVSMITAVLLTTGSRGISDLTAKRQLVKALGVTDLSLCSEARYTRHPSQADLFHHFRIFRLHLNIFPPGQLSHQTRSDFPAES